VRPIDVIRIVFELVHYKHPAKCINYSYFYTLLHMREISLSYYNNRYHTMIYHTHLHCARTNSMFIYAFPIFRLILCYHSHSFLPHHSHSLMITSTCPYHFLPLSVSLTHSTRTPNSKSLCVIMIITTQ
jgi:hypothetical protein